jgi:formyltetrahydrofolate deformylase
LLLLSNGLDMSQLPNSSVARLLITCEDKPGIIAAVSAFLKSHGANITELDQHSTDPEGGTFFMRLEFQLAHLDISSEILEKTFSKEVAEPFNMIWQLHYAQKIKKMALMVSKHDHAFLEVLWRWSRGELPIEIACVISNHLTLKPQAAHFKIPFYHIPVTEQNKPAAEEKMLALCQQHQISGIILARYMQILSPKIIEAFKHAIINIHHSFLPAFVGANPYQQAYDKGVKLIGATAHYVTEDLDMGPIIAQEVIRVTHRLTVQKLKELGQNVEKSVLARAIQSHAEDRIIIYGSKTIVFDLS